MGNNIKSIIIAVIIIITSLVFTFVFSFIKGNFILDRTVFMDVLFWIGIIISFIGGISIIFSFATFKRKLKKTPVYENELKDEKEGLPWGYIMFISGAIIFFISYYISVNI